MNEEKSFEELLDESFVTKDRFKPGEKVEAAVVKTTPEWVFIDIGGKSEGYIDKREFLDESGNCAVREGEKIQAYFLSSRNQEKLFTTRIGKGASALGHIQEAHRSGIPVEGFVEKEIKGGFEIKISGTIRCFCPYSLMDVRKIKNPAEYVGMHLTFTIIECDEKGRNIVLSRRAILEKELATKRESLKTSLSVGMKVKGAVMSVLPFGAFIDIGGVQGLLPASEIGWGRVKDIGEVLAVNQELELEIINLNWGADRITLSLKKTLPDPWENVFDTYPEGSHHTGTISHLKKFGAFVTLEPGVDGLVHVSELQKGKKIKHPSDVVKEGELIAVRVEKVDAEKRRLSLVLTESEREEYQGERGGEYRHIMEGNESSLGTLGDILRKKMDSTKGKK